MCQVCHKDLIGVERVEIPDLPGAPARQITIRGAQIEQAFCAAHALLEQGCEGLMIRCAVGCAIRNPVDVDGQTLPRQMVKHPGYKGCIMG